jgi:hypothetical protein
MFKVDLWLEHEVTDNNQRPHMSFRLNLPVSYIEWTGDVIVELENTKSWLTPCKLIVVVQDAFVLGAKTTLDPPGSVIAEKLNSLRLDLTT